MKFSGFLFYICTMAEILNLVNPNDKLSFKYEISRFPDDQQSLRLVEDGYNTFYSLRNNPQGITIYSRLNSFSDLEIIICATQALKEVGVKNIRLYIPYCIGARSDRKFMDGGINYVKTVIAPIINSQGYEKVTVIDPHSDVLEACINNFSKESNIKLVTFALKDYFLNKGIQTWNVSNLDKICLLSPDSGALKKVYNVAKLIKYGEEIIVANKIRNIETGKIEKTFVPLNIPNGDFMDKDIFIIDDICDGGRTFLEIAKTIKEDKKFIGKIYLIVTHGIFSSGFNDLNEYFDGIYTTNSVNQWSTDYQSFPEHSKLKQLNVF